MAGYRFYFDKDYKYFFDSFMKSCDNEKQADRYARQSLRMYANLYCRCMRRSILTNDSKCVKCGSSEKLEIDHIIAISNGGKNEESNIQILCSKCNNIKRNK